MENRNDKRLYRSNTDRMIAGVCGGMAEYIKLDPTMVRLLFALLSIFTAGGGLLFYIVAAVIIPEAE